MSHNLAIINLDYTLIFSRRIFLLQINRHWKCHTSPTDVHKHDDVICDYKSVQCKTEIPEEHGWRVFLNKILFNNKITGTSKTNICIYLMVNC